MNGLFVLVMFIVGVILALAVGLVVGSSYHDQVGSLIIHTFQSVTP